MILEGRKMAVEKTFPPVDQSFVGLLHPDQEVAAT